jgi:crossover junction endodeoxyribonuclease RusA
MRITVAGIPAPQGSKRHVGGGRMIEMSRAVGPWREAVRAETQRAMAGKAPVAGPVYVTVIFGLPRPKSLPKSQCHPVKRPDVDKLARAVLDGMTAGGAFADDSQVVRLRAEKRFAGEAGTGAVIGFGPVEGDLS